LLGAYVALGLSSGCSFIGGRVPHQPPPPTQCPEGVIVADIIGSIATLLPVVVGVKAIVENDSQAAVFAVYVTPPMALLAATYVGSTIYGHRARGRCLRMQEAATAASDAARPRAREPERDKVVGTEPLHCALPEQDVGSCFLDEAACAAEAARAGASCEIRTTGWCFDVVETVVPGKQTTCAPSFIACEARRAMFTSDRTLIVTKCGTYAVEAR